MNDCVDGSTAAILTFVATKYPLQENWQIPELLQPEPLLSGDTVV